MGKLKGLGKKKPAETPMLPVLEAQEAPPEDTVRDALNFDCVGRRAEETIVS